MGNGGSNRKAKWLSVAFSAAALLSTTPSSSLPPGIDGSDAQKAADRQMNVSRTMSGEDQVVLTSNAGTADGQTSMNHRSHSSHSSHKSHSSHRSHRSGM